MEPPVNRRSLSEPSLLPVLAEPRHLEYVHKPELLTPYNEVVPLRSGGEAFPAMLEAIEGAESHVHLETYILRADRTGRRFADALKGRARAGVTVRLIYDSLGSLGLDGDYVRDLEDAGVQVLEFHPVLPWRRKFHLTRRDHRKILVVDDRVAFTGGLNISDEYAPVEEGGAGWLDMHARVVGPVVVELARLFRKGWIYGGGRPFPFPREVKAVPSVVGDTALARVIDNKIIRQRFSMRRAYLHAINRAETSLDIMNAYFVPDRGIRWALRRAARRGVRVRIILPSRSDVPIVQYATRHLYGWLLKAGIRIFEWPGRMMHAKCAVIDRAWSTIGSYNLDNQSLFYNLEVGVEVLGSQFAARLQEEVDWALGHCEPVTLETWKRRPWWQKALQWIAFRFRRWL